MDSGNTVVGFPISLCTVQGNILQSFFECQLRGLRHSCKWLTDLLWSLNLPIISSPDSVFSSSNVYQSIPPDKLTTFLLARSCFDTQEYDHCAEILSHNFEKPIHDNPNSFVDKYGHVYYFMYIYSRYMACEKRRVNDSVESRLVLKQDEEAKSSTMCLVRCNKELLSIKCEIEPYTNKISLSNEKRTKNNKIGDSFLLYVHALICLRLGIKETAATLLVQAIDLNFYLWPAWYELVDLIENKEKMNSLNLPTNDECWMRYFFEAKVFLKLHEGERALEILLKLSESGFSKSHNLQAEIGLAYNELRAMELAKKQFKQLFNACPCRLDNVDTYSNVLFVCEDSTELAYLAHHCVNLDRYRAETCCVIGNFFGLRGQHEKAVIYFRRALKLKTAYSLVWTLVGHEYMELRNTNAAIHAYKQALVYNRHDYRAWYGLGQMYEVLNMLSFALYYYREAQYLMPTDSRLIVALGEIYVRLKRFDEAKKCYWRAYCVGDIEGEALMRLATCFERCGEDAEAAAAYTEFIKLSQRNGVNDQLDLAVAYKYLADYHLRKGHYEDSALAANKCLEFPETREEAKAMLRQITILAGDIEQLAPLDSVNNDNKTDHCESLDQIAQMSMKAEGSEISRTEVMKSSAKEIQPLSISLKQALTSFSESTVLKKRFYLTKQTVPSSTAVTNQLDHLSSSVYCNSDGNGDHSNNDRNCSRNIPLDTTTSSMELVTTGITTPLHHSHPPPLPPCDTESFNHTTCETPINNVTSTGVHSEFRNSLASSVDNEQFNALLSEHRDESMVISENDDA
ncbi:Cell division cycle protein 23 [Schistosoma japonicum]|uniref:Cell division cycle protein 23 n=1 Tax=Schistosoma japonicum TaxID=6182 RepID=A0A4Z2CXY4_SCHJA|nr:Cell division cycle protein 23 like [Schistosoma japonicum]KAH8868115.1 Cell division cycle protein 23 like [Schistosoma japonicum]TNN09093.1 Cell division cycle protein 23 [Schistosoma japonicum]